MLHENNTKLNISSSSPFKEKKYIVSYLKEIYTSVQTNQIILKTFELGINPLHWT